MLSDRELQQASTQLADFRLAAANHAQSNAEVLEKYALLMEEYQRLRSDFEEERESRERYKQMAKGQERNPFVLVLIDGDGYIFDDDLVSSGADGGQRAAQLLNTAVKESLKEQGLSDCKIMVRIYANLTGLSQALSKAKLAGPEKRSVAPFVANFNRSNELFDFVDAGELKENADFKIRSLFHLYAENAQCKQIYFAACHDVGYINELTPYTNARDRITLVRTNSFFHREFAKLGLRIEDFRGVFRSTPLDSIAATPPTLQQSAATPVPKNQGSVTADTPGNVCHFWLKGLCRYGQTCKNLHLQQRPNGNKYVAPTTLSLADIKDWRKDASPNKPLLARSDSDITSGHTIPSTEENQTQIGIIATLPREQNVPLGKIPVNREGHRIDCYLPPAPADDRARFNARTAKRKICNNMHLKQFCSSGDACPFDHSPITNGERSALREVAHGMPCPRKGACRDPTCYQGHVCQIICKHRGGKIFCKLPYTMHTVDLVVVGHVDGIVRDTNGSRETSAAAAAAATRTSSPSSTPSITQESDSDGAGVDEGVYTTSAFDE